MRFILLMAAALGLCGCDSDFDPRALVDGYRVFGVEADQPEPAPDALVQLKVHDFDTDGQAPSYDWKVCLYSFGSVSGFECVDPALEVSLGSTPEVSLDLGPDGLDFEARFDAASPLYDVTGEVVTLEDGHLIYVDLTSGVAGGRQVRTIKRLNVRKMDDAQRNTNPSATDVEVSGELVPGGTATLTLVLPEGNRQDYVNLDGDTVAEELLYAWYTTGGEYESGLTFESDLDNELTLPETPGPVDVFVAVRDGRGGMAMLKRQITVP